MQVIAPFEFRSLAEAQPGELVILPGYGEDTGDIAVVLLQNEDRTHLAVVRSGAKERGPQITQFPSDTECITYGTDWVLEVEQQREFRDDGEGRDTIGYVAVTRDAILFYCGRETGNPHARAGYVNFATQKIVNVPREATFTNRWRIWTDLSQRDRRDAKPLILSPPA